MKSDFTFVLHCAKCGLNGEIEEYTLRYQCPECGSEMRLSRIKTNISGEPLRTRIRELLSAKARGDQISGRIFALLADSSDPEVRKLIDDVLEEKYCRDHGIATPQRPTVKLEPEVSGRSATEPMSMDMARRDLVTVLSRWTEKRAARKTPSPPPRNAADHAETGYSEVTCPYCGAKKVIPDSFLGLYTRCRCGWTFLAVESLSTPVSVTSVSMARENPAPENAGGRDRGRKEVVCPYCGTRQTVSDSSAGLYAQCRCGHTFPVGTGPSSTVSVTPPKRPGPSYVPIPIPRRVSATESEVTCPYCGTKKTISNSFLGLYTRCRCGRTFPTGPGSVVSTDTSGFVPEQIRIGSDETVVACPYCGAKKAISKSFLGLHTQCPKCGRSFPTHD